MENELERPKPARKLRRRTLARAAAQIRISPL